MFTLIMNKKRITTLIIISFISGAILGGAGVFVYLGNTVSDSIAILSLQNRAEWEIRASNAYKNGSSEVGIWALTNLSEILKEDAKIFENDKDQILRDLLLTYGRLALLFQSQNDYQDSKKYISKAIDLSRNIYPKKFTSESDIITFVNEFDNLGDKPKD